MRALVLLLSAVCILMARSSSAHSGARSHSAHSSHASSSRHSKHRIKHRASKRCAACPRAKTGRISRSSAARNSFRKENPCPSTGRITGPCPGYVIDHKVPLKRGGADRPDNMQWQTKAAAKAKDRVE
ncbi:MAG: HNH endonuclease signature motif containing protein [Bryobacteraceae bacterium]